MHRSTLHCSVLTWMIFFNPFQAIHCHPLWLLGQYIVFQVMPVEAHCKPKNKTSYWYSSVV